MAGKKTSLGKNAIFNLLYQVVNMVFPLISASYVARVLSPAGVGEVSYAQNIVSYFVMFAALGIPQHGVRVIARCKEDPLTSDRAFSELVALNAVSTAICTAAYFVSVFLLFRQNFLLHLVFGLELVFNFINIDWMYQGREEYTYISLRNILVKLLSLALLFLLVKERSDYILYAVIVCLGHGCNYIFNVLHLRGRVRFTLQGLQIRRHLQPVFVFMLSGIASSLYSKVDITMLGQMAQKEDVGFYTNAFKLIGVAIAAATSLSAVFLPRLSSVYADDRKAYGDYVSAGLKMLLLLAVPCCFGLAVVAKELTLVLFGEEFLPAARTLRILAPLILIRGIGDLLCYQVMVSSGNERKFVRAYLLASAVNILLNAVLIPRFQHNGAAFASVVSELTVNGVLLLHSLRIVRPKVERRFLFSVLAGVLVMLPLAETLRNVFESPPLSLAAAVIAGAIGYFIAAWLCGNEILHAAAGKLGSKLKKKLRRSGYE